jgi:ABC-type dipeptide/oligopeptide/nickel transport system ATPase component
MRSRFSHPAHPYTRLLLDSVPKTGTPLAEDLVLRKTELPGNRTLPQGCFSATGAASTRGCEKTDITENEPDAKFVVGGPLHDLTTHFQARYAFFSVHQHSRRG